MADVGGYIETAIAAHGEAVAAVAGSEAHIARAVEMVVTCLGNGGKVLFCGNGGSAADAQHLAAELVGRFEAERAPWAAHALHTNTSAVTAVANDYGFEHVFARQVEAFGREGDVLVALSTSGASPNVLEALRAAEAAGMHVIALTGRDGGLIGAAAEVEVNIPLASTARVQEAHILVGHIICGLVEERMCEKP